MIYRITEQNNGQTTVIIVTGNPARVGEIIDEWLDDGCSPQPAPPGHPPDGPVSLAAPPLPACSPLP